MIESIFESVAALQEPWAYVVVAALAALESSLFVGLFVPGETAMVVGGFVVSQGSADLRVMIAVAVLGAVLGDSAGFEVGRRFGPRLRRTAIGRKIGEERWAKSDEYLKRRGGRAIFFGRFIAVFRSLVPALAGTSRMPYGRFLVWNALGGAVWASIYVTIGYLAGGAYEEIAEGLGRAAWMMLGLAIAVGTIVITARWVAADPARFHARTSRVMAWPPLAWFQRTFATPLGFVGRRLRPGEPYGLPLTLGLAFLVAAAWALATLINAVAGQTNLPDIDRRVTRYLVEHREDWADGVMRGISHLGDTAVLVPLMIGLTMPLVIRRRQWSLLVLVAVAALGAVLLSESVKQLVERARPPLAVRETAAGGFAFPSGHAMHAAVNYSLLAYVFGSVIRSWPVRVALWAAALTAAVGVGLSRVYLGVHWLTDVLGGYALGALWLSLVVTAYGTTTRLARSHGGDQLPHAVDDRDHGEKPGDGEAQAAFGGADRQ